MIVSLAYRLSRKNAELRRELRGLQLENKSLHLEVAVLKQWVHELEVTR